MLKSLKLRKKKIVMSDKNFIKKKIYFGEILYNKS